MASTFSKLCAQLSQHLVPALLSAGFTGPSRFHRGEIRYEFRRKVTDGTHVFSVLFDKYRRPVFSVQLFVEPLAGIDGLVSRGGTLIVGNLAPFYRSWPFRWPVFRAERPKWQRLFLGRESTESRAVQRCIDFLPEVETWWGKQVSSRHIIAGRVVYRGVSDGAKPPVAPDGDG